MSASFNMPNPSNIQGLILSGYSHPYSCHLLFTFPEENLDGITSFFNDLYDKVQSAENWGDTKPDSMLNIGLTYNGLSKLNVVKQKDLGKFPPSFRNGPWSGDPQKSLTDKYDENSDPKKWWQGENNSKNEALHCIVHAYALSSNLLENIISEITNSAINNGLEEIIPLANNKRLYQTIIEDNPHKVHFRYTDSISQPSAQNSGVSGFNPNPQDLNNFLVGYNTGSISQPGPIDRSSAGTFAKDGCYNAFRVLYQDVFTFNQFLKNQVIEFKEELSFLGFNDQQLEEWFAAKLCGRWRNGSPLINYPDQPGEDTSASISDNNFGYAELDSFPPNNPNNTEVKDDIKSSISCPFSSHIRVSNTRNQNLKEKEGGTGAPRLIRRGVPYGASLDNNANEDDQKDRGLIGMFLCGNLSNQFERLYGWMNLNNFSDQPIFNVSNPPQDALIGNRALVGKNVNGYAGVVGSFEIPLSNGKNIIIPELPQFLATRGTAYCFLPSMNSLAQIAGINN